MNQPSVYIESSVVSYLAARPSRDIISAAAQKVTWDWWESRRTSFDLYASALVIAEISKGDPGAAQRRREFLGDVSILPINDRAEVLAQALLSEQALPKKANADALHVSIGAVQGVDYLLTWNCIHIDALKFVHPEN